MKVQLACKVKPITRRPSTKDYKTYVANNDMIDWPISINGVNADGEIFDKDKGSLRVKTVQSKPHQVWSTYINTPNHLVDRYQSVTLSSDFMFVNDIPFLIAIIHTIKFTTYLMNKY